MAQDNAQLVAAVEHAPSSAPQGGFPPFNPHTFPSQLFWWVITFTALYLLMSRVALPRVGGILEHRRRHIDNLLAEAQRFKEQSDATIAAQEKALAEARSRAQALASETRQQAAAAAEARRKGADAKLHTHIAEAEKSIAAARSAAMANLRDITSELAGAIVERLTGIAPASREVADAVGNVLKR
jgi:F-type H+-transporting ATPase subunit b